MADLLECLIQIKGVADTPRRLTERVRACLARGDEDEARDVAARMAGAEARFASCLSMMLAADRPSLPSLDMSFIDIDPGQPLGDALQEFGWRRQGVVAALERCSADDLNRIGFEPSRGPMTVADLVALMLAHDTEQLARLL